MDQNNEVEIDVRELFRVILNKLGIILMITFLCGAVTFSFLKFVKTPVYEAQAKLLVNTRDTESTSTSISSDQIKSAVSMVDTYSVIIKSRTVLEPIIQNLHLDYDYEELAENITVKSVNSTQIMEIAVDDENQTNALNICSEIMNTAPDILMNSVNAGSVSRIEEPYLLEDPVKPEVLKMTVIMAAIGFVLSAGFFIVQHLFDNTYSSEVDLQSSLELPVIGVLPSYESCIENNRK